MFSSSLSIPNYLKRPYATARVLLYGAIILSTFLFALAVLFPTFSFTFDFRTPNSSANSLLDPHTSENIPATNGKIETNGSLFATASATGRFSQATVALALEQQSPSPQTLQATLKRSYRAFFLPLSDPITSFPKETLYRIDTTYYALRDGTLYPFVSDSAYLSRFPDTFALQEDASFLSRYPLSPDWIGFRIGSLVSFADGVFIIVSDTEMRPIGSAEILLALGYRFENVIPASEEEIGIYKRGRIVLLGALHPDGTLFLDSDTDTAYLIENNQKRPIYDNNYRDFIASKQTPIVVSTESSQKSVGCALEPGFFGRNFSCETPVTALKAGFGNDYELTILSSDDIDIRTLQVSLETEKSIENVLTLLSQVKLRLLSRFGAGQ